MPPWPADPHYGKFSNDRSLTSAEIDTLVAWADSGAREGDPSDAPKPAQFVDGWGIRKPDAVFEMPNEFAVPASGTVEYQYIVIPPVSPRTSGFRSPRHGRATARWSIT